MVIFHEPRCADYGSSLRPEQPARILKSVPYLQAQHPTWAWRQAAAADEDAILRVHTPEHWQRLQRLPDFDEDTPYFPGIAEHARRAAGSAIAAARAALAGERTFSLMRPPGHHATEDRAMGFCYLNSVAIAVREVLSRENVQRVAVWDFDAHHGNGTEAILRGRTDCLFASVHQSPGYPGTGLASRDNCHNWPLAPRTPRSEHLTALRASFDAVIAFQPDLVVVSAGFDAYARDPITVMSLETEDFKVLGSWLHRSGLRAAAVLEGGYSADLPQLIEAFLVGWEEGERHE